MTRMRVLITGLVTTALLTVAAIVAVASIPASDGTINGCYKNGNGALSVIDSAATCPNGTTPLNWNQTGLQGPAGPEGPAGQDGSFSGFEQVLSPVITVPAGGAFAPPFTATASCPAGKTAISGGHETPALTTLNILASFTEGDTYTFKVHNAGAAYQIQLHVACAVVTP